MKGRQIETTGGRQGNRNASIKQKAFCPQSTDMPQRRNKISISASIDLVPIILGLVFLSRIADPMLRHAMLPQESYVSLDHACVTLCRKRIIPIFFI